MKNVETHRTPQKGLPDSPYDVETERRNATLRATFESSADALATINAQGEIQDINPALTKIFGYRREEMLGNNISVLMPETLAAQHKNAIRNYLETGVSKIIGIGREVSARHKTGRIIDVHLSISQFELDGEIFFYGSMRDITAQKAAIKERNAFLEVLQHSQRMEQTGSLARGIAHDFNNILTPILGHASLALQEPELNSQLATGLEIIKRNALRAKSLIQQILEFSTQERSTSEVLNPETVVHEAEVLVRSSIPTTIQFKSDIAETKSTISGSCSQIHQAIINLVNNSIEACAGKEGHICLALLEVSRARPTEAASEICDWACVSIIDSGVGIAKEYADRVFDPFFTTKRQGEGPGLGLSVVFGIMKSHQGFVELGKTAEGNTRADLYFPIHQKQGYVSIAVNPNLIQKSARILVVADDETNIKPLAEMVAQIGFDVALQSPANEILKLFTNQTRQYDLLIVDARIDSISLDKLCACADISFPNIAIVFAGPKQQVAELANSLMGAALATDMALEPEDVLDTLCEALSFSPSSYSE